MNDTMSFAAELHAAMRRSAAIEGALSELHLLVDHALEMHPGRAALQEYLRERIACVRAQHAAEVAGAVELCRRAAELGIPIPGA